MDLNAILSEIDLMQLPGAYDALSARLIEQAGYPIVYFTGLGNEASDLGFPDIGLTTASEMARRVGNAVQAVEAPVICDADTGFGGPVNVRRTVRTFETAGVAAIHLEDQTFPKRCGLLAGKTVIPATDFAGTLDIAIASRRLDTFGIIARTDAKEAEGIDGVIERLKRYQDHGADMAMVGDFYELQEYEKIARALSIPLVACASDPDNFHRQPDYTKAQWQGTGVKIVLYWHLAIFAAIKNVTAAVTELRETGSTARLKNNISGYDEYAKVTDLDSWIKLADGT